MKPEEFEALKTELKASEESLKGLLSTQSAEIKKTGETAADTAAKIKAAEGRIDQVVADIQGKAKEASDALAEQKAKAAKLEERLDEMEKAAQRPGWGSDPGSVKSVGEQFIESEQLKGLLLSKDYRSGARMETKSILGANERAKAAFLSDAATRLVMPTRASPVTPQQRRLRVRDLIPVRPTISNSIEFLKETGFAVSGAASGTQTHGAAAPVSEGQSAPEAQLQMELLSYPVQSIEHWIPASRRILDDMSQLRSYIDDRLLYGLEYREEVQLLYGDGSSPSLHGILTESSRQTYDWSDGTFGDSKIDALRRAMTKSHVAEYVPSGVVLNPNDWEDIELAKGSDGHYLWINVTIGGEERLFRMPLAVTNAIVAGTALVGAFAQASTLWDREDGMIRVSDSHADFFIKQLLAILAAERLCLTTYRPDAYTEVTFDEAPAEPGG